MRYNYNALSPNCMHKNNTFHRYNLVRVAISAHLLSAHLGA